MSTVKKLMGIQDARSTRGILSRGTAKYGFSRSPKPGNLFNVQRAAQNKVKRMKKLDKRRIR
jgi:hypothetical protein